MWYCDSSGDKEDSDDGHKGRTLWYHRCLPSSHSSKTTCWRSNRSSDEEGDNEDDADGRKDDVGDVEADSHHSLLSPRCQGLLGLAKSIIIPDISTIIIKMTVTTIVTSQLTEVKCVAGSSKTNLAIPSSPFSALSLRQSLVMMITLILILMMMMMMLM